MCTDCIAGKYSPTAGMSALFWGVCILHERSMRDELTHACSWKKTRTVVL
jgi:hypothetical protein